MSCKPLTKKEWQKSVSEMWGSAVESAHMDLIEKAVLAEREACAKLVEEESARGLPDKKPRGALLRMALTQIACGAVFAKAIRARGQD
jgi:hypothetical protein